MKFIRDFCCNIIYEPFLWYHFQDKCMQYWLMSCQHVYPTSLKTTWTKIFFLCPEVGINFKRRLALWPHIFVFEKWTSILDKIVFEGKNDRHMMIGSLNPFRYSQIFQYQVTKELWNCDQNIIYWHTCYKTLKCSILLSFEQLGWHKFSIYKDFFSGNGEDDSFLWLLW